MRPRQIPTTPTPDSDAPTSLSMNVNMDDDMLASRPTYDGLILPFGHIQRPFQGPDSASSSNSGGSMRFATTTDAFGLVSPSTTSSLPPSATQREPIPAFGTGSSMNVDVSPPSAGTVTTRRLRRPSMLSFAQNASFSSDNSGKADDEATPMAEAALHMTPTTSTGVGNSMIRDPSSSKAAAQLAQPPNADPNSSPGPNPNLLQPQPRQSQPLPAIGVFNSSALHPSPRWPGHGGSFANSLLRRTSSAPSIPFEDLKTSTPPIAQHATLAGGDEPGDDMGDDAPMDDGMGEEARSPLKWAPSHLGSSTASRSKGKARMDDCDSSSPQPAAVIHQAPFTGGRPLPSALLQTLASETAPLDHEMQSEARLQRLLMSHPQKLPLTPRAPRGSRGRFPDQVGGDDDEDDDFPLNLGGARRTASWTSRNWRDRARMDDSDSDSDEMLDDGGGPVEPVNSAFAAGMDMDRPGSSSSSGMWISVGPSDSGKSTPGKGDGQMDIGSGSDSRSASGSGGVANPLPTPPSSTAPWPGNGNGNGNGNSSNLRSTRLSFSSAGAGMVPSPGNFGLPSAFGTLGMGGIGTPVGSPTVERLELGTSPGAASISSPGLMQYRESQGGQATVRPGKRKAQAEDRFDPYKRSRGSSPSLIGSSPFPLSPSRTNAIPIPQSPSHAPLYPSALSTSHGRHGRGNAHPYTRPMASRSRAASPALSIGSGPSSLGNGRSFSLAANGNGNGNGANGGQLGGLGLLSIQNRVREEDEDGNKLGEVGGEDMSRGDSGESRMEED